MPISPNSIRIATILDKETAEEIKKLAEKEKRTLSAMVALLLKKALQEYKK